MECRKLRIRLPSEFFYSRRRIVLIWIDEKFYEIKRPISYFFDRGVQIVQMGESSGALKAVEEIEFHGFYKTHLLPEFMSRFYFYGQPELQGFRASKHAVGEFSRYGVHVEKRNGLKYRSEVWKIAYDFKVRFREQETWCISRIYRS